MSELRGSELGTGTGSKIQETLSSGTESACMDESDAPPRRLSVESSLLKRRSLVVSELSELDLSDPEPPCPPSNVGSGRRGGQAAAASFGSDSEGFEVCEAETPDARRGRCPWSSQEGDVAHGSPSGSCRAAAAPHAMEDASGSEPSLPVRPMRSGLLLRRAGSTSPLSELDQDLLGSIGGASADAESTVGSLVGAGRRTLFHSDADEALVCSRHPGLHRRCREELEARDRKKRPCLDVGSHAQGACMPCCFWLRGRCIRGLECRHCHLPHPELQPKKCRPSKRTRLLVREMLQRLGRNNALATDERAFGSMLQPTGSTLGPWPSTPSEYGGNKLFSRAGSLRSDLGDRSMTLGRSALAESNVDCFVGHASSIRSRLDSSISVSEYARYRGASMPTSPSECGRRQPESAGGVLGVDWPDTPVRTVSPTGISRLRQGNYIGFSGNSVRPVPPGLETASVEWPSTPSEFGFCFQSGNESRTPMPKAPPPTPVQLGPEPAPPPTPGGAVSSLSRGSALHDAGACRPCAWHWRPTGCQRLHLCDFCHTCPPNAPKERAKQRRRLKRRGKHRQRSAPRSRSVEGEAR